MPKDPTKSPGLKPFKITCTSSDCNNGLHCFKKSRKMAEVERGRCRSCGTELIDWQRVQKRDVADVQFTFSSLRNEFVRHHFWHKQIDKRAENYARRKGRSGLQIAIRNRLVTCLSLDNPYDGIQTPYEGNIIFYAQHAVACCCRACLEYWHGIPKNTTLSDQEINYLTQLITLYIDDRLPDLAETGQRIPSIRVKS